MVASSKTIRRLLTLRRFRSTHRPKRRTAWEHLDAFLRHPATLLILGFILTAIVGATIQKRQQELEEHRARIVTAIEAVDRINSAITELRIRGHILGRAKLPDAMLKFDEAFFKANTVLRTEEKAIRRYLVTTPLSLSSGEYVELRAGFAEAERLLAATRARTDVLLDAKKPDEIDSNWDEFQYCVEMFLLGVELNFVGTAKIHVPTFGCATLAVTTPTKR